MAEPGVEPTLRSYLHVLRRGRWWVAAGALLGLGISLILALTGTKQYSATAQLLVQSTANVGLTSSASQLGITTAEVQTELQLVTSAQVQKQVISRLGRAPSVAAAEIGQTNVIALTAVGPSPAEAALIANTYAQAFVAWSTATASSNLSAAETQLNTQIKAVGKEISALPVKDAAQAAALSNQQVVLKGQLAQLEVDGATASTGLELVNPATAPVSASSPKPVEDTLLGLIVGLVIGIAAAFLRDTLDDTLTSGEAVERVLEAPVLASVPMVASWRKKSRSAVIAVTDPTSQPAEAYRSLRTSLQFARPDRRIHTLLVTSPGAGDGKTSTVVNLGAVFAQAGSRVVVVSCDLRRPGLSQFFAPAENSELAKVLDGSQQVKRAVTKVADVEGLWTLSTKGIAANPTELLAGDRMRSVLEELAGQFDVVLIDSPPVLPVADALILSKYADAVLVVVATGQTRRAELRRTRDKLIQAGAPLVGAVLNKATARDGYGYGGGYQPYVMPRTAPFDSAAFDSVPLDRAADGGHDKQNGFRLPSGQPGRSGH